MTLFNFRVSLTPVVTALLTKKGFQVKVEKGAGIEAKFRDADYAASGAVISDKKSVFESGMVKLQKNIMRMHKIE